MSWLRNIISGLRGLLRKKKLDQQLEDELHAYLEMAVESKLQAGMSQSEALRAARAEMGSMAAVREQVVQTGWESAIGHFGRDLRFAARMLRRNPGISTVVVLTLGLGIGLNVGIFSILNSAALRLLPVPHAKELMIVSQSFEKSRGPIRRSVHQNASYFSYSEYLQYREGNQVFSGLLAYTPFVKASLGGDHPQQLIGTLVSCNYFAVLEITPHLGRSFSDSDCGRGEESSVVVLSDEIWRTTFAADPEIVGKKISLSRTPFVVVGVAPAGFQGTSPLASQFWAPLTMQPSLMRRYDYLRDDKMSWLGMIGRSKPNVSQTQIRADLAITAAQIDQLQPGRVTTIETSHATLIAAPEERFFLFGAGAVLLVAMGMILLIACANVANLLLARAVVRGKEIAVRRALGASRWRLVRQLLAESLLLAFVGGGLGTAVAISCSGPLLGLLLSHLPPGTPPLALNATPDFRVLVYTLLLSFFTGLAFGLTPALHATRADLVMAMKEEGAEAQSGSSRNSWLRSSLVAIQIAVCLVFMITAGLLLHGLQRTYNIDPGFSMKNTVVLSFDLIEAGYSEQRAIAFRQQLAERIRAVPGVDLVAQAGVSPLSDDHVINSFSIQGKPGDYDIEVNNVSPDYFPMLGIPIVRGRNFTIAETLAGSPVVILTESTARRLWPGEHPIGKTINDGSGNGARSLEVVGITRDAQVARLGKPAELYLYRPTGPEQQAHTLILAHFGGVAPPDLQSLKTAVQGLDPELSIKIARLEDNMEFWRSLTRIPSVLSVAFGGLALLLASIGVYGMLSYAVSRRIREIGIRVALGASAGNIVSLIVRQGMRPVAVGASAGMALSAAISSPLSSLLYGVSPWDPISFLAVPGFLFAVALAACWAPARRAARVDPMQSLRCG
jgi:predicted permease